MMCAMPCQRVGGRMNARECVCVSLSASGVCRLFGSLLWPFCACVQGVSASGVSIVGFVVVALILDEREYKA